MTIRLRSAVVVAVFAGGVAALVPPPPHAPRYAPPIAASIQRWDMTTLARQARQGRVRRAVFRDGRDAVEVLDANGLQRRVDVFPPAASLLLRQLHEAGVDVSVAAPPPRAPAAAITLARHGLAFVLITWMLDALGVLWLAVALMLRWWAAVERGWRRTWRPRRPASHEDDDDDVGA